MNYFDVLLAKKLEDDRDPKVEGLSVTENGRYHEDGVVYDPVIVNVPETPLSKLTVTQNGTYTAPSGTAYSEVDVDVPLPENAYLLKEIEDVEIASFNDGSDLPMPKLEVGIEPQQDLHGYDAPWVGGAGKNLLKIDSHESGYGITNSFIYDSDNNIIGIKSEGTSTVTTGNAFFLIGTFNLSAGNYVLNGGRNGNGGVIAIDASGSTIAVSNADDVPFTLENEVSAKAYIRVNPSVPTTNSDFYPMIRLASVTDGTFAPYSNICPISGWSEANVSVCGKNMFGGTYDNIYSLYIPKSIQITLSTKAPQVPYSRFAVYDKDQNMIDYWAINNVDSETGRYYRTFTFSVDVYYVKFYYSPCEEMQIKFGTDVTYEPYNGSTITIQLGDTYYGGKLDVVSGVLTVDRANVLVSGCTWYGSNGTFYTDKAVSTIKKGDGRYDHCISDAFKTVNKATSGQLSDGEMSVDSSGYIQLKDLRYSTPSDFKTNMGSTQLVYELATPIEVQLTPTQVSSLLGQNNVWADTGNILDLSYLAKEE